VEHEEGYHGRSGKGGVEVSDSGVGVLDRCVAILDAVEHGARSHAEIVEVTGNSRTTAHRMLKALEAHGFIAYQGGYGYRLGPRLLQLAAASLHDIQLRDVAHVALERLAAVTGESAQLYVLGTAGVRVCVDSVQSDSELRTIVPVGAVLPVTHGSAGKIFMAWAPPVLREELVGRAAPMTDATPTPDRLRTQLVTARRLGWASSAGERQAGVGSVSAPVLGGQQELVAVVSISGPTTRIGRVSAKRYAPAVKEAAREIERALGTSNASIQER
jgi:DNA-binding IclR family transcriptional regulator